ncbi:MAG: hypothetical protein ACP5RF_01880 [Candidatus Micrarchaeia archaeon]
MGARNLTIAFATLLLFAGSGNIFAQSTCEALPSIAAMNIGISSLFSVFALAFMLSFLVIAIGFIISKTIPGTKLDSWLKGEFWEASKSFMLIAGSIGILVFLSNISLALIGQPGIQNEGGISSAITSLGTSASTVLCNIYFQNNPDQPSYSISQASEDLVGLSLGIGFMRSITIGWWIPIPIGIGAFTFGSQFSIYNNPMLETDRFTGQYESALNDDMQFLLIPMGLLVVAQYYLMPLIIFIGLMVLMPLGILFRAFPFLRGIGGTLFAFGIGLAIVYPTLIVVFNMPVNNIISQQVIPQSVLSCSLPGSGILGTFICGIVSIAGGIVGTFSSIGTYVGATTNIYDGLNITTPAFIYLFAQFMLFIFDLMIAYPIIDSIAKALGGTIRMNLGSKLGVR